MSLKFHCKCDAIDCLYGNCHQTVTQVFVDSDALVRPNGAGNAAELGEQLARCGIAITLGVVGKTREINENKGSAEAHSDSQHRGVTDVLGDQGSVLAGLIGSTIVRL